MKGSDEYPNAVICELGYDVMDRVAGIAWSGYDGADVDSREYSYDNADNIVSIATADGATIDYAYDGIDRLAGESKSDASGASLRSAAYIYDDCGNRICKSRLADGVRPRGTVPAMAFWRVMTDYLQDLGSYCDAGGAAERRGMAVP